MELVYFPPTVNFRVFSTKNVEFENIIGEIPKCTDGGEEMLQKLCDVVGIEGARENTLFMLETQMNSGLARVFFLLKGGKIIMAEKIRKFR